MSFEFARRMQREAEQAARRFENDIYGIKPWYSYAGLFDGPATMAFIGAQPGGGPESMELDRQHRNLQRVYTEPGYNSWLDDTWEGEKTQGRACRAFKAMYGNDWEQVLRDTSCFNVAPFRAHSTDDLPRPAWEYAQGWFKRVIEHLRPQLIVCNGNGGGRSRSPWTSINRLYSIDSDTPIPVQGRASLKIGAVESGPIAGARIVGLPNLSRFGPAQLFHELQRLQPFS